MEKMKRNILLIPFIAVLTLMITSLVSADGLAYTGEVQFNDVKLNEYGSTMVGMVGEVVPIRAIFTATKDASDVRLKVRIEGTRDDVYASTERFDILKDVTYTKLLSLKLPSDLEDDLDKNFTLYVELVSATDRTEVSYNIRMQRGSYTLEILSVDYEPTVEAGEVIPVSVVASNNGFNRAQDNYVVVSIPALGISSRGYVGDLDPLEDYNNDDHEEDSAEEVVYLKIPSDAQSGVYEMEIELYNDDSSVSTTELISVKGGVKARVLASVKSQDIAAGGSATYELILVNSGNDLKVFSISAASGNNLRVDVPSIVTVGPQSSETVSFTVSAPSDAQAGTYAFSVAIDGEEMVFGANVVESSTNVSTPVVALTVILVIIFIVLLAVLITLLARKEKPAEEVETSYY